MSSVRLMTVDTGCNDLKHQVITHVILIQELLINVRTYVEERVAEPKQAADQSRHS